MGNERKSSRLTLSFSEMNDRQHETLVFPGVHLKLYPGLSEATRNFLEIQMYVPSLSMFARWSCRIRS